MQPSESSSSMEKPKADYLDEDMGTAGIESLGQQGAVLMQGRVGFRQDPGRFEGAKSQVPSPRQRSYVGLCLLSGGHASTDLIEQSGVLKAQPSGLVAVGIPGEIRRGPFLAPLGPLVIPRRDMTNLIPDAILVSRPFFPYCGPELFRLPRCLDRAPRNGASEDKTVRNGMGRPTLAQKRPDLRAWR